MPQRKSKAPTLQKSKMYAPQCVITGQLQIKQLNSKKVIMIKEVEIKVYTAISLLCHTTGSATCYTWNNAPPYVCSGMLADRIKALYAYI